MTITGWRCDACGKPIRRNQPRVAASFIMTGVSFRSRSLDLHDTCYIDRILPVLPDKPDTDKEPK